MRQKFTPGPWAVDGTLVRTAGDGSYRLIARTDFSGALSETNLANAQLCAAAPELLEALKHALKSCGGHDEFYWSTRALIDRIDGGAE